MVNENAKEYKIEIKVDDDNQSPQSIILEVRLATLINSYLQWDFVVFVSRGLPIDKSTSV